MKLYQRKSSDVTGETGEGSVTVDMMEVNEDNAPSDESSKMKNKTGNGLKSKNSHRVPDINQTGPPSDLLTTKKPRLDVSNHDIMECSSTEPKVATEADRDSVEVNALPEIVTETTSVTQEDMFGNVGMLKNSLFRDPSPLKSTTLENISGMPFNHEAHLSHESSNQTSLIPGSFNSRFSNTNNNLSQNLSNDSLDRNIPSENNIIVSYF